jgi:phosphopantothenoylcysteine decarboxylase/phosphopantothenate--cysteine ligase
MKILVTAGGTEEPVDSVRRLTNTSSGATGTVLARHFSDRGAEVLLLHAERAPINDVGFRRETFVTFVDLKKALHHLLSNESWDVIVHLAAVGDYSVASVEVNGQPFTVGRGKIGTGHEVTLQLTANPKIIDSLRRWSLNPEIMIVGFKLTDEDDPTLREKAVHLLMDRARPDLVVHNDLGEIDREHHKATIYDRTGLVTQSGTKAAMAQNLWHLITQGAMK